MGIYGNTFKDQSVVYTEAEINEALLQIYSDLVESYENEDSEDVVTEGANLDMRDIWKKSKAACKTSIKNYKKYYKSGEYKKAANELNVAKEHLIKNKKALANVSDSDNVGSAVLGFFAAGLCTFLETLVPGGLIDFTGGAMFGTGASQVASAAFGGGEELANKGFKLASAGSKVSKVGVLISQIHSIIIFIKDIMTLANEIKKDKEVSVKHFNMYRTRLLRYMDDSIKKVEKLQKELEKAEEKKK